MTPPRGSGSGAGTGRPDILGVVLAGGQSSRFGSDKALALLDGRPLLDHAVAWLAGWCGGVVVAGRDVAPVPVVADWPRPGMGPLGGLAAGLRYARAQGFAAVFSCGVDSPRLPEDLAARFQPGPAFLADQPVVGLWPVTTLAALEEILNGPGKHSLRALAEAVGARAVQPGRPSLNINRPEDLAALSPGARAHPDTE